MSGSKKNHDPLFGIKEFNGTLVVADMLYQRGKYEYCTPRTGRIFRNALRAKLNNANVLQCHAHVAIKN